MAYTYTTWENLGEECGLKGVGQAIKAYEDLRRLMDPRKKDKKEKKRGRRSKVVPEVSGRGEWQEGMKCGRWCRESVLYFLLDLFCLCFHPL